MSVRRVLAGIILITASAIQVASGSRLPATVSPGATSHIAVIDQRCPTFSWEAMPGAAWIELVGYAVPADLDAAAALAGDLQGAIETLYTTVPGGATAWTPSLAQSLTPGKRYVWFVRPLFQDKEGGEITAGAWSEARYFALSPAPTAEEVRAALEVLRRWEVAGQTEIPTALTRSPSAVSPASGTTTPKSGPVAPAAIRAEHSDVETAGHGVVGVTASALGAGLVGANLEGGPDLLLDGSADGAADVYLYHGGLYVNSAADESFLLHNYGAGSLDLGVSGTVTASGLDCPNCVATADLADDAVTSDKIANGAVDSNHLITGSVRSAKILDGTIVASDLATGSVTSDKILDGTITANDLAGGSVTMSKIAQSAVGTGNLADHNVTSIKIADGAVSTSCIANQAVTGSKIMTETITHDHISTAADSGIYTSAQQLDVNTAPVSIAADSYGQVNAFCDDPTDLALECSCYVSSFDAIVTNKQLLYWDTNTLAASCGCFAITSTAGGTTLTATIICIPN